VSATPLLVCADTRARPVMLSAIPAEPVATSATLRLISTVVAVCSSTAAAIPVWVSLIWAMIPLIWAMATTAAWVSAWIASMRVVIPAVAVAVSLASSLTSPATTAKPLPASPARAASMVA
jgi:hypothetical protein